MNQHYFSRYSCGVIPTCLRKDLLKKSRLLKPNEQYKDMMEFQFGLFNNANNSMINSIDDAFQMIMDGKGFGIGAQFHNVSKAQIYGIEISTNGVYNFNKNTTVSFLLLLIII